MRRAVRLFAEPYFKKVLIANRGEITCRVINTCRRLNIPTVAIYSTADSQAKHVKMADEAFCVGPPQSAESYLRIDKIIDVCKRSGADAVHPGYGFLSENASFSKALHDNGITFVGPRENAIHAMGDKIESKMLAKSLGVNVIPGFDGEIRDEAHLLEVANEIGYPIMMKASAGGGGKGMCVATNDKDAVQGYHLSKTEAMASFGDDRMLVEKFVQQPRHIEIQIIGDQMGNIVYLPERECSIQRRNQKVIEEAPSTFIDPATRKAMGEQAVMLAKGVNYHTAGTVEMMVDAQRNFYFLEMNTRLQVEHPITEMITGVDLVEEMLRAAAGLPLSVKQEDIRINGWATESRVYAEDPLNNFLPVIGRLTKYVEPVSVDGVRVDSGILEGSEISLYYDPLISKLCTWGATREESISRMSKALDNYVIRGLARTNINFLRDLMTHPKYLAGDITTKFIEEEFAQGYSGHQLTDAEERELVCVATVMHTLRDLSLYTPLEHVTRSVDKLHKRWVVRHNDLSAYYLDIQAEAAEGYLSVAKDLPNRVFRTFRLALTPLGEPSDERNYCPLPFDTPNEAALVQALSHQGEHPLQHNRGEPQVGSNATTYTITADWELEAPIMHYTFAAGDDAPVTNCVQMLASPNVFHYRLQYAGSAYTLSVLRPVEHALGEFMLPPPAVDLSKELRSPMPGVVVEMLVKVGDKVNAGQQVGVLEAMKMRNGLTAAAAGVVKAVLVPVGENVDEGATLVVFE
eukprot:NODE_381_length_2573_cov_103.914694_g361_i0.p1 GENE.NODE_381_length_2573_cov_103.914694_g361_i0~~NODE_381_length_2573_cov_103.914694_g361_i0.p1  ORF type:complete len:746 (+),score=197.07 NODE_381_length_2573_cov_103.914694_g361_i0:93-2330(+)